VASPRVIANSKEERLLVEIEKSVFQAVSMGFLGKKVFPNTSPSKKNFP
jgi:hypothetical protein